MRATGSELEIGVFRLVVVDLTRDRGVASGGVEHKGGLIGISVIDEGGSGQDSNAGTVGNENLIKEFCAEIGLSQSGSEVWGDCSTVQKEVELWCSVLRQHVVGNSNTRPLPAIQ